MFIPKTIILDGQDKNANYLVKVSGNISGMEAINVIPNKTFNLTIKNANLCEKDKYYIWETSNTLHY